MSKSARNVPGGYVVPAGAGSSFTVWVPFRTPAEGSPGSSVLPAVAEHGAAEARVALVVEDDQNSAELIRVQLEAEGFSVLHAPTAAVALQMVTQQPLSLITLDIMLPDMNGWELLTCIRGLPGLDATPIVVISIVADPGRGNTLGASAVMEKPISRSDLVATLQDLRLLPVRAHAGHEVDDDPSATA